MRASEELRNDHGTIRAKLSLLEGVLPLAPSPDVQVEEPTATSVSKGSRRATGPTWTRWCWR